MYAEVAKICGKNKSICEIVMREKEICTCFTVTPQTAQVMTIVDDKCLVKVEKMLNLWVEDTNREGVSSEGNVLCQEASLFRSTTSESRFGKEGTA